jgi:hypothetical protein
MILKILGYSSKLKSRIKWITEIIAICETSLREAPTGKC